MSLLEVNHLTTQFTTEQGQVQAVRDVSFSLEKGEILGIVGESGSGKSQAMYSVMGLLASNGRVTEGSIRFNGTEIAPQHFAGGMKEETCKVVCGGPMMGIAVPDLDQPVLKNTNAVLAMTEADAVLPEPTACIRCGRCIRHCPLRLMPSHIVAAYEAGNMERLAELKVNLCMECGCCSFGCPAHRPLVQTNKLAKAKLAAWRKAQSEKLDAKKEAVK